MWTLVIIYYMNGYSIPVSAIPGFKNSVTCEAARRETIAKNKATSHSYCTNKNLSMLDNKYINIRLL